MDEVDEDNLFMSSNKKTKLLILLSALVVLIILATAFLVPFKDKLLSSIYPKPSSYAASVDKPDGDISVQTRPRVGCNYDQVTLSVSATETGGSVSFNASHATTGTSSDNAADSSPDEYGGGASNCSGVWTNKSCTASATPNRYTWTHYWQHCFEGTCAPTCSKQKDFEVVRPAPPPPVLIVTPTSVPAGEKITVNWSDVLPADGDQLIINQQGNNTQDSSVYAFNCGSDPVTGTPPATGQCDMVAPENPGNYQVLYKGQNLQGPSVNLVVNNHLPASQNINLITGWNYIGLSIKKNAYKGAELLTVLNKGRNNVAEIRKYQGDNQEDKWVDASNTNLAQGKGYFIRSERAFSATIRGETPNLTSLTLNSGWNAISFPFVSPAVNNAADMLEEFRRQNLTATQFGHWDGSMWNLFTPGDSRAGSFTLTPGSGYIVYVVEGGTFVIPPASSQPPAIRTSPSPVPAGELITISWSNVLPESGDQLIISKKGGINTQQNVPDATIYAYNCSATPVNGVPATSGHCNIIAPQTPGNYQIVYNARRQFNGQPWRGPAADFTVTTALPVSQTMNLSAGWSLVGINVSKQNYKAQDLLNILNIGGNNISQITKWQNRSWVTTTDFDIKPGEGYFIKSNRPVSSTIRGNSPNVPSLTLSPGWNLISLPSVAPAINNALNLMEELKRQRLEPKQIVKWGSGKWNSYLPNFPAGNFNIVPGEGYFVNLDVGGTFVLPRISSQPTPTPAPVCTPCAADISFNGTVDQQDVDMLRSCYNKRSTDPNWSRCQLGDINNDGIIDASDLACVSSNFGQRCTGRCTACNADINKNGTVDNPDYYDNLSPCYGKRNTDPDWNRCQSSDIIKNGSIGSDDYVCLASKWGQQCVSSQPPADLPCTPCTSDIDRNGIVEVNGRDYEKWGACIGSFASQPANSSNPDWNLCKIADTNGDNVIDTLDYSCIRAYSGQRCTLTPAAQSAGNLPRLPAAVGAMSTKTVSKKSVPIQAPPAKP